MTKKTSFSREQDAYSPNANIEHREEDFAKFKRKEVVHDSLTVLLTSAARPTRHGELIYKTK